MDCIPVISTLGNGSNSREGVQKEEPCLCIATSSSLFSFSSHEYLHLVYPVLVTCYRLTDFSGDFLSSLPICAATLDIILSFIAWKSLKCTQIVRYLLKFAVAAAWVVVLPIGYSSSVQNPTGLVKFFNSWAGDWRHQPFYNYAIALYFLPNILAAVLFLLPPLRRTMERSNLWIITLVMWWAQASMSSIH